MLLKNSAEFIIRVVGCDDVHWLANKRLGRYVLARCSYLLKSFILHCIIKVSASRNNATGRTIRILVAEVTWIFLVLEI